MNQNAIRYGGFMGLALVLVNLLFYLIGVNAFFSYAGMVGFLVYIGFMVKAGLDERMELGGFMTFGEAFKVTFQVFVIGSLIYWIFYYLLFTVIDPSLVAEQKRIAMEAIEKVGSFVGEEAYEVMIEQIDQEDFSVTLGSVLTNYIFGLVIPGALIALVISLFIKRANPDELSI